MLHPSGKPQMFDWGHDLRMPMKFLLGNDVPNRIQEAIKQNSTLIHRLAHANRLMHYGARSKAGGIRGGTAAKELNYLLNRLEMAHTMEKDHSENAHYQEILYDYVVPTLICIQSILDENGAGEDHNSAPKAVC